MFKDINQIELLIEYLLKPHKEFPILNFKDKRFVFLYYKVKKNLNKTQPSRKTKMILLDYLLFCLLYQNENDILKHGKTKKTSMLMELLTKYFDYPEIFAKNNNIISYEMADGVTRLIVLLTHSCQLRCEYCSVGKYPAYMNEKVLKKSIDLLFTSKKQNIELQFFGGEPLLKFNLVKKAVKYAKDLEKKTSKSVNFLITTNGIALSEEMIDFLVQNKFTIEFSMDGDKETQLKYRKSTSNINYYEILLENLEKLKKKKANFSIISVIMPEYIQKLYSNVRFFLERGYGDIQINYALGNHWDESKKQALFEQFRKIQDLFSLYPEAKFINNLKKRKEPVVLNAEVTVDCDGQIFLETGICLETDFEKLKKDFKIGHVAEMKDINTIFTTKFRNFYRLVNVYTKENEEYRKIILNNIKVGTELNKYNNFSLNSEKGFFRDVTEKNKDLTLTLKCNNNCIFCPKELLSDICVGRTFEKIREELKNARNEVESLTLSGGEVSSLSYFFDILKECRSLKFKKISIITNGRNFSDERFTRDTIYLGLTNFGVSIYSTYPNIHEKITQVSGSFQDSFEGLKNLIKLNCNVWVNITVSSINQSTVAQTLWDLHKLGVKRFQLISVITENSSHEYSSKQVIEEFSKIKRFNLHGVRVIFKGFSEKIRNSFSDCYSAAFVFEPHEFNTFFNTKTEKGNDYLEKAERLAKNQK